MSEPSELDAALARALEGEPEPGDGPALAGAMEADAAFADEVRRLFVADELLRQAHEPDADAFAESVGTRLAADADGGAFERAVFRNVAPARRRSWLAPALAASLPAALGAWLAWRGASSGREVAWLTNAQDCRWEGGDAPAGALEPGKVLRLAGGLAELTFPGGVEVVVQGPAELELVDRRTARLRRGRLAARVPEAARGFTVLSPTGRIIDLGTEFGVEVADDGTAEVHVFRGEVAAERGGAPVSVKEAQTAKLAGAGLELGAGRDAGRFVRAIVPPPVIEPRTLRLDFRAPVPYTLADGAGAGTGFTHRLPGTGADLPPRDAHLRLFPQLGRLELRTTQSDLNGQKMLGGGEYLGVRLADLGFTGAEDFAVTAVFPNAPALEEVDQFGLFAGPRSDLHVRGGLMRPGGLKGIGEATQFLVRNDGGADSGLNMVGLVKPGNELAVTLKRVGGRFELGVEDRTTGAATELAIRHPPALDAEAGLIAGVFGATPWRMFSRSVAVTEFTATVWTKR